MQTEQMVFWQSQFGEEYTERNIFSPEQLDAFYEQRYTMTRTAMMQHILKDKGVIRILEVGCNVGNQLRLLQTLGYTELYGIELQHYAVERAKQLTTRMNIIQGSAFELPFKDNYFDLVMTNGVLIHLAPADIGVAMREIVRVSNRYVMGFEYFSDQAYEQLTYRGNSEKMWKTDFAKQYLQQTSGLNLVEQYHYLYNEDAKLVDHLFLLQKSN